MAYESRNPELLAPAGNMECLHAAVCAGADAVYLGLDEFNARRNADNFTLETLKDACNYAHLRGVRIYVTMNIEILPSELQHAIDYVRQAYEAGADAFIVQDAGLATELHRALPQAEVHISTQMNIHNAAGIEAAACLGARRVTLARELSIGEIAELSELAAQLGMEIECFAHGALCICYSGQCLMSSMIGGRSANRGLCAQACRLPYELHRQDRTEALPAEGEHLLSPRDLCSIDLLGQLTRAGVASLKIEGRMKSADYVHEVVSVYREALDAMGSDFLGAEAGDDCEDAPDSSRSQIWRARLAEAFSRGFTTAYLEGNRGNDMMSYGRPNNRGVFAGRVTSVENDIAEVAPEIELHEGDVLEFWTNRGHFAATVPASALKSKGGKNVSHSKGDKQSVKQRARNNGANRNSQNGTVRIPVEQRIGKGDRVFRVRNAATAFTAFDTDPFLPRVNVLGHVTLLIGQQAHIRFATAEGVVGEAWGDVVEPAHTKALSEEDVRAHVDRLGQTPFVLQELDVVLSDGAGMGFSQLHHLRADALDALSDALLEPWNARTTHDASDSSLYVLDGSNATARSARSHNAPDAQSSSTASGGSHACAVMAWVTNPSCARAARRGGADSLYVPLLNFRRGQAQLCGARQDEAEQAGYPKQSVMAIPTIDHDPITGTRESALAFDPWDYVREGKTVFADSLAGAIRALDLGARVEIGPHVPLTNSAALRFIAQLGVARVWLSPELTLGQISQLAEDSPVPLGLFVSGAQELMICEHCLLMSQGPCNESCETCPRRSVEHKLVDRKGFEFPVLTDMLGRSHLYNGIELDAIPTIPDFVDMGISAVMVDATLMDKKTTELAVKRAVRAVDAAVNDHRALDKRPGTTTGHLFRGVM